MIEDQDKFPLLERYKAVFPVDYNTIFAYNNTIYTNNKLTEDLIIHEVAHLVRQAEYGLDKWVNDYLEDPKFRLEEEIWAYKKQLESIKDREQKNRVRIESSRTLSSPLYGNLISKAEAFSLLKV